ncbi:MalY/PatB family protein [Vibrio natriegens]|uniref:cysteine-S-conjugate beta-lyase n=1 Tax=Vibrio natriegens NBRC 15636 = ATCC 14048 = DSM 759 TaxID=1219067 RepID=A0AAN0Y7J2_VIBNA|nr:MalY/PatB family protein [Vibrio natriegens]ALR18594.1 cystathionine beta-lyase [Vibrio natriegens NBRC 15636 = ATCC 14048 = DSM 759]ANQ14560.1 cystathionine beta-lyase [Vibrio natriegens NBRC 15636 = ATCC 14048 = DSM 759]EPM39594.1 cystathionine beta-lyase [Vibrio natriegens NBRC 15636 = ATCC 14048 = DSM 759]MDX6028480.1 MalY/PatB family protein [Vibrio natriegens NBRC 15636 = ATCC 14048 = DSM 759]UUI13196.1 pyridoxal phosphate-dependent aminotransferase [Vibrio natriegens]
MSSFNFDQIVERKGSGSVKWDSMGNSSILPMWVADMDFRTAEPIVSALKQRVEHGVFGYTKVPDAYYAAVINWFGKRHNFHVQREWIQYTSGVVPALSAILKALTNPGDGAIVQTPAYNCFFSSIRNMDCHLVENPLVNRDGYYEMDFDDLERKASRSDVKVLILCNPHNPVGRAWTQEELTRLGEICFRHGVKVISDEIHCDLTFPGVQHQPFAALGDEFLANTVTTNSPSKSFNIAGLQIANIITADKQLRDKIDRVLNIHEVCDVNPFGVSALMAAYNESEAWLYALREYLHQNYLVVVEFINQHLPRLSVVQQEATYLAWIDCRQLDLPSAEIGEKLITEGALMLNQGAVYGTQGEGYIRLNMACPRAQLLDGLQRMARVLGNL